MWRVQVSGGRVFLHTAGLQKAGIHKFTAFRLRELRGTPRVKPLSHNDHGRVSGTLTNLAMPCELVPEV